MRASAVAVVLALGFAAMVGCGGDGGGGGGADAAVVGDGGTVDGTPPDAYFDPDGHYATEGMVCGDSAGDLDAGAAPCGPGLVCCYPCGIPNCNDVCQVPCPEPYCVGGCPQLP